MRGKFIIVPIITFVLLVTWQTPSATALVKKPLKDSRELQFQDMLMLFLLPYMNVKLAEVYSKDLNTAPELFPYFVDVTHVERVNGFRGYDFLITLDAIPTVGPHIPVGEDLFTFKISPIVNVKLVKFEHLKGPNKKDFTPNYQDLIK